MLLVQRNQGILLFLLFLYSFIATANDQLELSGFATIGAVYNDSKDHGYRKTVSSDEAVFQGGIDFKQHSLLGLQADWSISSDLDLVYQGVLRELPDPSFDRFTTLAFLRYEASPTWSFRVGRTAPDIFLLTEYRDVDFSYAWATAPNEVYGIVPYRSLDGADITHSYRALGGIFKTKAFTGTSEAEISATNKTEVIKIEDVIGVSFSFDHFNWIVNAKHTQVTIANEPDTNTMLAGAIGHLPDFIWPNAPDFAHSIMMKGQEVRYSSLSGQYQWPNWLASAEFSQINSQSRVIPKITSGYGALSYQMDEHQIYGIFAVTDSNNYDFNEPGVNQDAIPELVYATTVMMNFYATNQQTMSLGWRWDISSNIASSLQWNHTKIKANGSTLWLDKAAHIEEDERANVFLFTLSMVF